MGYVLAAVAVLVGVLLGLLGGGGSILTVPVLVYLGGVPAKQAIVTSLVVVGITSAIAVLGHARKHWVCWKTGVVFGGAGMVGAFCGGRLTAHIPDAVLLLLFALVMLAAASAMLLNKNPKPELRLPGEPFCPVDLPLLAILFDGLMVGAVTGLVGVGGGFLLVPALNALAGLPIQAAIGTSLFIIVMQSAAALYGHAGHLALDWPLTGAFAACTITGSLLGSLVTSKIDARHLKKGFGVFVLALGGLLLYRQTDAALLRQIQDLLAEHRAFIQGMMSSLALLGVYRLWVWVHRRYKV